MQSQSIGSILDAVSTTGLAIVATTGNTMEVVS
jgi:hypothetical protein